MHAPYLFSPSGAITNYQYHIPCITATLIHFLSVRGVTNAPTVTSAPIERLPTYEEATRGMKRVSFEIPQKPERSKPFNKHAAEKIKTGFPFQRMIVEDDEFDDSEDED